MARAREASRPSEDMRPLVIREYISSTAELPLPERQVVRLLLRLMEVLNQENNVLLVPSPIYLVGDIHGQLDDLLWMFQLVGAVEPIIQDPSVRPNMPVHHRPGTFRHEKHFLFMGDYVDRGHHSLNTFLYLAALKLEFPQSVYLLRGNHESRQVSNRYGFYHEIILNYGHAGLWMVCNDVFDLLPMAALVDHDVFCVHGGLSPAIPMIEKISLLDRQVEIPQSGPLADLCWSDPENVSAWRETSMGAGYLFGRNETTKFTRINRLDFVARSHQLAQAGYAEYFGHTPEREYRLITICSAPNYCYKSGNEAAIMALRIKAQEKELIVYHEADKSCKIIPPEDERPVANQYFG
jgi:diadenosine tetraphosphatase ApaH/serine/threonine PP2A family protein phosphatase